MLPVTTLYSKHNVPTKPASLNLYLFFLNKPQMINALFFPVSTSPKQLISDQHILQRPMCRIFSKVHQCSWQHTTACLLCTDLNSDADLRPMLVHTYFQSDWDHWSVSTSARTDWQRSESKTACLTTLLSATLPVLNVTSGSYSSMLIGWKFLSFPFDSVTSFLHFHSHYSWKQYLWAWLKVCRSYIYIYIYTYVFTGTEPCQIGYRKDANPCEMELSLLICKF